MLEHRVATYPVDDPTWYGPISVLLAVLEVDAASICASVPVFWPVLTQQLGKIFVTKEFAVVHEERYDLDTVHSPTSRTGSEAELHSDLRSQPSKLSAKETHYDDAFVMRQVDPLAQTHTSAVEGGSKNPKRSWFSS